MDPPDELMFGTLFVHQDLRVYEKLPGVRCIENHLRKAPHIYPEPQDKDPSGMDLIIVRVGVAQILDDIKHPPPPPIVNSLLPFDRKNPT